MGHKVGSCKATATALVWPNALREYAAMPAVIPIRLAVYGVHPTPIRAELGLQLDLSVGPGGSGLTRPPPP